MTLFEGFFASLTQANVVWLGALWRASWQGGLALAAVWTITCCWRRMNPLARVCLWRLAFLKLLITLCCVGAVTLRIFPPSPAPAAVVWVSPTAAAAAPAATGPLTDLPPATAPAASSRQSTPSAPLASAGFRMNYARCWALLLPLLGLCWLLGVIWNVIVLYLAWRKTGRPAFLVRWSRDCNVVCRPRCLQLWRSSPFTCAV